MHEKPNEKEYDVFLSHCSQDSVIMRDLAERLERDGLEIWLAELAEQSDSAMDKSIENALESSRIMVLGMSRDTFGSEWATLESRTFRFRDPSNKARRFIPIRLDDAEINDALKQFAYVDWREQSPEQYARLLATCRLKDHDSLVTEPTTHGPFPDFCDGHANSVWQVAITPDGMRGVSGAADHLVGVWNISLGRYVAMLSGHTDSVRGVAVTADGKRALSGSDDKEVRLWDLDAVECTAVLKGHTGAVLTVTAAIDGRRALSGSEDCTLRLWDLDSIKCLGILSGHEGQVTSVAITNDAKWALSGSNDRTLRLWDLDSIRCVAILDGHTDTVRGVTFAANGTQALSVSQDKTMRLWDLNTGRCITVFEGHTQSVCGVAVSSDGKRAVSISQGASSYSNSEVAVWDLRKASLESIYDSGSSLSGVALSANGRIAFCGVGGGPFGVQIWDLALRKGEFSADKDSSIYTNAKVLLVGESGVGKTALAHQLVHHCFRESISTDAAWATQLKLPQEIGHSETEREIWIWDFAGQADYRLIHQLYMDETALAVLVFNPQSENPFEGLNQWDGDLQRAARRPFQKLLVAGRTDRGGLMLSSGSIERFRQERGFADYIETSALVGTGCDKLRDAIIHHIAWAEIPWTTSPRIFRLLKDEIIKLKDEGKVLLRMAELKQQLEMRLSGESFTLKQLRAVVGLLAGPGVVWQLEFGDFVVLRPEWINIYAAALIRSVRAHLGEIGVILEQDVLSGNLKYTVDRPGNSQQELGESVSGSVPETNKIRRLSHDEESVILRAMHQTFVDHGLCLREYTEAGTQLVFPSYFRRELPKDPGHPPVLVSYKFNGNANDIYATLIVQLHHTKAFTSDQLWRYAADFKTHSNKRMGLMMTKVPDGTTEICVYFEPRISEDTQVTFIKYVHEHLLSKARDVKRLRHYVCEHCSTPVENRQTALDRLKSGKKDILCVNCEKRIDLWDLVEQKFSSPEFQQRVRELEELAASNIDNESKDLILRGHAYMIAGEAGQIYREYSSSDHGIDGEIEFKDHEGKASGRRLYLQLKSGDSYLYKRKEDGAEIFKIKKQRWVDYWQQQSYPVMLVIRTSDEQIRWMNVTDYLLTESKKTEQGKQIKQIVFDGQPFTALSLVRLRDRLLTKAGLKKVRG